MYAKYFLGLLVALIGVTNADALIADFYNNCPFNNVGGAGFPGNIPFASFSVLEIADLERQVELDVKYDLHVGRCMSLLLLKELSVNGQDLLGSVQSACGFQGTLKLKQEDFGTKWCLEPVVFKFDYQCNGTCENWPFETSWEYNFSCGELGSQFCWNKSIGEMPPSSSSESISSSVSIGDLISSSSISDGGIISSSSISDGGFISSSSISDGNVISSSSVSDGGIISSSSVSDGESSSSISLSDFISSTSESESISTVSSSSTTESDSDSISTSHSSTISDSSSRSSSSSSSRSTNSSSSSRSTGTSSTSTSPGVDEGPVTVVEIIDTVVQATISGRTTDISTRILSTRTNTPSGTGTAFNGANLVAYSMLALIIFLASLLV